MKNITIQHIDPGKSEISMDKEKYDILKKFLIRSLIHRQRATFEEILADVLNDLKKDKKAIAGSVHWNLALVQMDMEAKCELVKDAGVFPHRFLLK